MKYLIILSLFVLTIHSCKSKKAVQKTEKVEVVNKQDDKKDDSTLETPAIDNLSPEEQRDYGLIQKDFSDSLVAQIRRTPCFGYCPSYVLNIYESGYAEYKGERNVKNIGLYAARVDPNLIAQLVQKAEELGFFQMEFFYDDQNVTDLPSTITSIRNEQGIKSVVNRFNGPKELMAFNKYFDELFAAVDWQRVDSK